MPNSQNLQNTDLTNKKGINSEKGNEKVNSCIQEIEKITDSTLDKYQGMKKIKVVLNGKEKEIYIDKINLRVDSSEWQEIKIHGVKVKINEDGDIIEYLTGKSTGEQLFTWNAAVREAEKKGKRLPTGDDFQAIIDSIGLQEFMNFFPGYLNIEGNDFGQRGRYTYFWLDSLDKLYANSIVLHKDNCEVTIQDSHLKNYYFSVHCIISSN